MTHINRDRWKEIIGPEFDLMVKRFLVYINDIKKASEEKRLVFPDAIQERIRSADREKSINPDDGIRTLVKDPYVMKELGAYELLRVFDNFEERLKREPKKLFEDLEGLYQKLPDASRLFYTRVFAWPKENLVKRF